MAYFLNPYNFVSLKVGGKSKANQIKGDKSGYIDVELEVNDEIIIPGEKNEVFDYYHYKDNKNPIIPSSQFRGTVRSVYEALTNSCLSKIDLTYITLRNGANPKLQPYICYYKNGKWFLKKAIVIKYKGACKVDANNLILMCRNEQFSIFQSVIPMDNNKNFTYGIRKGNNSITSILCIGELRNDGKRKISIFQEGNEKAIELNEIEVEYFLENLKSFTDSIHKQKYIEAFNNKQTMAVYASNNFEDEMWRISKSQIGRVPDFSGIQDDDFSAHDGYQSCKDMNDLCPGCALFGTIYQNERAKSRVRFTELNLKEGSSYEIKKPVELVSLGPNISNPDFYTEEENPWLSETAVIRGRKFYWHFNKKYFLSMDTSELSKDIKASYTPLGKQQNKPFIFKGKVYFENLSDEELKMLLFAISLGNDGVHAHKIGHGKPLGYGSVIPKITSLHLRTINVDNLSIDSNEVDLKPYMLQWNQLQKDYQIKELDRLLSINFINNLICNRPNYRVSYPYVEGNQKEGFAWFMDNKNTKYESVNLPKVMSSNLFLSTEHKRKNRNYKR